MQDALLVVDMQVDFCEGGALVAHDTESMIDAVNALVADYAAQARLVIFTRDWHPTDHCSFRDQGGPWPPHCVKETRGAQLHPGLEIPPCQLLVSKATGQDKEAYSAFDGTGLRGLGCPRLTGRRIAPHRCARLAAHPGFGPASGGASRASHPYRD